MKRGDVVLVDLPRPASGSGREQFGSRPAVIVQNDEATSQLETVVVVPLTSNALAAKFRGSFVVSRNAVNGLSVDSIMLTHQVRALDKKRIQRVLGVLEKDDIDRLDRELGALLGLPLDPRLFHK